MSIIVQVCDCIRPQFSFVVESSLAVSSSRPLPDDAEHGSYALTEYPAPAFSSDGNQPGIIEEEEDGEEEGEEEEEEEGEEEEGSDGGVGLHLSELIPYSKKVNLTTFQVII